MVKKNLIIIIRIVSRLIYYECVRGGKKMLNNTTFVEDIRVYNHVYYIYVCILYLYVYIGHV